MGTQKRVYVRADYGDGVSVPLQFGGAPGDRFDRLQEPRRDEDGQLRRAITSAMVGSEDLPVLLRDNGSKDRSLFERTLGSLHRQAIAVFHPVQRWVLAGMASPP